MSSVYYLHTRHLPLASRLSVAARRRMFLIFMKECQPSASSRVLDIGPTSDASAQESNFFEAWYPYPANITAAGTEDASHLESSYPGLRFIPLRPHEPLPFTGNSFDLVFSNAVLEHVGAHDRQKEFIAEALRVAPCICLTTPNRWFPFEMHTGLPLLHWLPPVIFRMILRHSPWSYWASEEHLNLLSTSTLMELFPANARVHLHRVRTGPWCSNLIVIAQRS